jgi:hypothetical protein
VAEELDEGALQLLEVLAVGLHMVGVDVGDHRDHRLQVEERRVRLVGLGHEELALAEARVGADGIERPPMTMVGSRPASPSTAATREVVVVLPCVPAMAMPCLKRISSASIIARGTTGMCASRARTTSGLSGFTALDTTTASAVATFSDLCPIITGMPIWRRRRTAGPSDRSEPVTV